MALENWARNWSCGKGARPGDVASQYHEDAVRRDVNTNLVSEGPKGVSAFAEMYFAAVQDAVCEVVTQVQAGDTLAIEWTWSGTHTGDIEGWPATGKHFTLEGCNIIKLDGGKIREERSYWDWDSLRAQA